MIANQGNSQAKICGSCTFINTIERNECEMCGTALDLPQSSSANCPICGISVPTTVIEVHVNDCLASIGTNDSKNNPDAVSAKRKQKHLPCPVETTRINPGQIFERTLTSAEQVQLYKQSLCLAVSSNPVQELQEIMTRLFSHMTAEKREEQELKSKGNYIWEYEETSSRSGSKWIRFDTVTNLSIESDRRAGKQTISLPERTAKPQKKGGEGRGRGGYRGGGGILVLDIARMVDNRGGRIRRVPCGDAESSHPAAAQRFSASSSSASSSECTECIVCAERFSLLNPVVSLSACGHAISCRSCFQQYVSSKVEATQIFPWIPCLSPDCHENILVEDLMTGVLGCCYGAEDDDSDVVMVPPPSPLALLQRFCIAYLSKLVVRFPEWTPCCGADDRGDPCPFGFLVDESLEGTTSACELCGLFQDVERQHEAAEEDEGLCKMLAEGTMRKCPKCDLITMKEFGVCNVIQCEKCSIWWNWRTRETGRNSRELKQKARMSGTLWEPGELDYQSTLERSDPEAFKTLLERNGVTYDPNYRRGT